MASSNGTSMKDAGATTGFWKRGTSVPGSIKPVYGAQHPPIQEKPKSSANPPKKDGSLKSGKLDAFHDFENKTLDAWDDGDDDLITMANIHMSLKDVRSTAKAVLDNHSRQVNARSQEELKARLKGDNMKKGSSALSSTIGSNRTGPGLGVRLNNTWQPPKQMPIRYTQPSQEERDASKLEKFKAVLAGPNTDLDELRKLSWSGIPKKVRPTAWKILSGYLPASLDRRQPTLERKRKEYFGFIDQYYVTRHDEMNQDTFRQPFIKPNISDLISPTPMRLIHIDIPRMNPLIPIFQQLLVQEILKDIPRMTSLAHLFQQKPIQEIFERILYIWAIRHPASGYVQGINDLVTPFFVVFLSEYIDNGSQKLLPGIDKVYLKERIDVEVENVDLTELSETTLRIIEADTFWCTSKLLDGIQDNYTFAQPGIQTKVNALRELIKRIDAQLHAHMEEHSVEYLQFSFRWMNNLLMREIPLRCTVRLWDTYQSELNGFADFHLYVCAAFLKRFSQDILREKDFQGILMFLQNLPTYHWSDGEIGELLAEAFKLKYMFADAPNHLSQTGKS